jgi:MoxR-like ATPase
MIGMLTDIEAGKTKDTFDQLVAHAGRLVVGKESAIRQALACLAARGHLLIEDLPGVGQTLLAHVLARTLGLQFRRIQFTSDLLPADILGVSVYDREANRFLFHPGPVFSHLILADEINRATPKAQSALLEAMEEGQVTVDGDTRPLPSPFYVIATQNPTHQIGTFPLPESQLDRFLMRIRLGYPDPEAERTLLKGKDRRDLLPELEPHFSPEEMIAIQKVVPRIHASEALLDYVQALLQYTRSSGEFRRGLSPRAGLALLRSAQAWSLMQGRTFAIPEDVQAVLPAVVSHRLEGETREAAADGIPAAQRVIEAVPIP